MSTVGELITWFTTADHWQGSGGVPHRLVEHIAMAGSATLTAAAVALPVGVAIGHRRRRGPLALIVLNVANLGRAIPSYGILVLCTLAFGLSGPGGFGARPAFIALVALAIPPMITNSYIGVRDVDPDLREAARGMGMTRWELLVQVELPVAAPLVLAGVRTATVQVVATATLAAATAWGGLGRFIVDGFAQRDDIQVLAGAILVALLAGATELLLGAAQRRVSPSRAAPASSRLPPEVEAAKVAA
jgi:osmoprotectant transport system permease protein